MPVIRAEVSIKLSVVFPKEAGVEAGIEAKMKPEFKALQGAGISVWKMTLCWRVGAGLQDRSSPHPCMVGVVLGHQL